MAARRKRKARKPKARRVGSDPAILAKSDLYTEDDQFEAMWEAIGNSRSTTKEVKVPRDAVMAIMMDHSQFYARCFPREGTPQKVQGVKR